MAATILSVTRKSGPNLTVGGDATAEYEVVIAGSQAETLINDLFGAAFVAGWGYVYSKRAVHPQHSWLRAESISFLPDEPTDTTGNYYDRVRARIVYKGQCLNRNGKPDDPEFEGAHVTHATKGAAEFMTIPGEHLVWADDGKALPNQVDVSIRIPVVMHTFTVTGVASPPWTEMKDQVGKVNSSLWCGFRSETLLFNDWNYQRDYDADGTASYQLTYTFAERVLYVGFAGARYGWNHFYRPRKAIKWQRVKDPATGAEDVYEKGDFSGLFQSEV